MIKELLDIVAEDYRVHRKQEWIEDTVSPTDINALRQESTQHSKWDEGHLRLNLWKSYETNRAYCRGYSCEYGRVIVLSYEKNLEPPNSWIRIFRLLKNSPNPIRVLWIASSTERIAPPPGQPIKPDHINGGYTQICNSGSIVIYRKEEATRVLIHELLHASCTDPKIQELENIEADTEAWAEVILTAIAAQGNKREFEKLWALQSKYAVSQAESVRKFHNVNGPGDYSWRYVVGRLEKFIQFGLPLIHPKNIEYIKSVRLTHKKLEPTNT